MPRSRTSAPLSMARSPDSDTSHAASSRSNSVVLPWSTCAQMHQLRMREGSAGAGGAPAAELLKAARAAPGGGHAAAAAAGAAAALQGSALVPRRRAVPATSAARRCMVELSTQISLCRLQERTVLLCGGQDRGRVLQATTINRVVSCVSLLCACQPLAIQALTALRPPGVRRPPPRLRLSTHLAPHPANCKHQLEAAAS